MSLRRWAFVLMFVAGCKACKKPVEPPPPPPPPPPPAKIEPVVEKPIVAPITTEVVQKVLQNFQRVNFEFDSTALTADSMNALRENAKILSENPNLRIEVQGHADERGTTEYNLALGERRSKTIQSRLVEMGVPAARVTVISYGEERPLSQGTSETVWAQNRRAEFRVIAGSEPHIRGTTE